MSQHPIQNKTIIVRSLPNYQLRARVTHSMGSANRSLELEQLWPEAQHPHWRRVAQFNLSCEELRGFAQCLLDAAEASA